MKARRTRPDVRSVVAMSVYAGRFAGRCAVVTGGASGLGKATAARIVAEGGKVVLAARGGEVISAAKGKGLVSATEVERVVSAVEGERGSC